MWRQSVSFALSAHGCMEPGFTTDNYSIDKTKVYLSGMSFCQICRMSVTHKIG